MGRRGEGLYEHGDTPSPGLAPRAVVAGRGEARLQGGTGVARDNPVEVVVAQGAQLRSVGPHEQLGPELHPVLAGIPRLPGLPGFLLHALLGRQLDHRRQGHGLFRPEGVAQGLVERHQSRGSTNT